MAEHAPIPEAGAAPARSSAGSCDLTAAHSSISSATASCAATPSTGPSASPASGGVEASQSVPMCPFCDKPTCDGCGACDCAQCFCGDPLMLFERSREVVEPGFCKACGDDLSAMDMRHGLKVHANCASAAELFEDAPNAWTVSP